MENSEVSISSIKSIESSVSQKGRQALSDAFDNIILNKEIVDKEALKNENIRYQPRCANKDTINKDGTVGIYEYTPVVDAIENIPDPFNIFPKIETVFSEAKGKENRQIIAEIVDILNNNTDTPTFIEKFDGTIGDWARLDNGNVYSHASKYCINNKGLRVDQYEASDEIWADLQKKGYSENIDYYNTKGSVILINEIKIDDIDTIATPIHELGHIVENEFVIPQKQAELEGKEYNDTEVISTLYGIKAGLMMAEVDQAKATEMIIYQTEIYNWVLAGTVAP